MTATISITTGDPGGIGPETIVKALSDPALRARAAFRILGPASALDSAAVAAGIAPFWKVLPATGPLSPSNVIVLDSGGHNFPRRADRASGELSFGLVEAAIAQALCPKSDPLHCDAVVTGPINKLAWQLAGHDQYPGHTELFAARCNSSRYGMMFISPRLRVILATTHLPLMDVRSALTTERILEVITLGHKACQRLGIAHPRIAVCGLNPHAGEGGVLGHEESRIIEPAIRAAVNQGINASGPFPGDTIFNSALAGNFDLVVAMYHDQGLIPVKLLDRDRAVNITVGLPIIRTSPDHGTAFDIAGQNKADPGSMKSAIELAIKMTR